MKIAIVGGSGFIGTRLIECLLAEEPAPEVVNIDIAPSEVFPQHTVHGDVTNADDMRRLLKGVDQVVLLAAQHRDDVHPSELYYTTNVGGMENLLDAMEHNGVKRLLFFSTVSVYGINKHNPDEDYPKAPFNHYGKSKWKAEQVLLNRLGAHPDWNVTVIRPTVIFGERNRGNVYNLLHQIASGTFMMVGNGKNRKSMAYVGNVVAFAVWLMKNSTRGFNVYNYVDKPDFTMNDLVSHVSHVLERHIPMVRLPYCIGMAGGYFFDFLAWISGRNLAISSVRVKKFCATTEFNADRAHATSFVPPFTLGEGLSRTLRYEFLPTDASNSGN